MMPGHYDLTLYRGDTRRIAFLLWEDEGKTTPVDTTGATAAAQIRGAPGGPVLVNMECTIPIQGRVEVAVPASQSANLTPRGVWDLQLTMSGGDIMTVVAGRVCVVLDVTVAA